MERIIHVINNLYVHLSDLSISMATVYHQVKQRSKDTFSCFTRTTNTGMESPTYVTNSIENRKCQGLKI